MGLRRGLFLGLLAGLIGALLSRSPAGEPGDGDSAAQAPPRGLLDEARAAARDEREATERHLRERLARARRGDPLPSDD